MVAATAAPAASAHTAPGGYAGVSDADKRVGALLVGSSSECSSNHLLRSVALDIDCFSHRIMQSAALCRYSPALVATYALHDLVSAWRYATDRWLGLHDSAAVRLLSIASRHLQQKADAAAAMASMAAAAPSDACGSGDSGDAADQQCAAVMQPAGSPADDAIPQQVMAAPDEQEPPSPRTPDRAAPGESVRRVHMQSERSSRLPRCLPATCCVLSVA